MEWLNKLGGWSWSALESLIGLALFVALLIPLGNWVAEWATSHAMFVIATGVAVIAVRSGIAHNASS